MFIVYIYIYTIYYSNHFHLCSFRVAVVEFWSLDNEKVLPRDWYTSLAMWSLIILAARLAFGRALSFWAKTDSPVLVCGGQKVRNSPGVEPREIQVFRRMMVLIGARSDAQLM